MTVLNGFDVSSGERVFVFGADNSGFFEDAQATSAWELYAEEFGTTPENQARLGEILSQLHGGNEITLSQFVDALETGMSAGEFEPKVVARQAPVETTLKEEPVDRNGRPLTEPQKKWAEYRVFAESHSSRECRERARVDAGFASFVRKHLQREMTGVGDAVENLNAVSTSSRTQASPEVSEFANRYRTMSSEEVRRLSRADSNPHGYQKFNTDVNAAIAAGLI